MLLGAGGRRGPEECDYSYNRALFSWYRNCSVSAVLDTQTYNGGKTVENSVNTRAHTDVCTHS